MAPTKKVVCFLRGQSFCIANIYFCHRYISFKSSFCCTWKPNGYSFPRVLETRRNKQAEGNFYKILNPCAQAVNLQDWNDQELYQTNVIPGNKTALAEGIRLVAIGKYGAKFLSKSLTREILEELEQVEAQMRSWENPREIESLYQDRVLQRAAFLGSLYMKSNLTEDEQEILRKYELGNAPTNKPCSEASLLLAVHPNSFQRLEECHLTEHVLKLLQGNHLNALEAEQLGEFILECKTLTDACLSAMVLHVLRVQHETSSELIGFARACQKALETNNGKSLWKDNFSARSRRPIPVLQITEPFDGVVKSPMVTPLIAKHMTEKYGIWTVLIGSETSGPKYGMNLKTLVHQLGEVRIPRVTSRSHLEEIFRTHSSPHVLYMDLEDVCHALSKLTYLRRTIIKRPCFATVEKAINYIDADVLLTSAFHPNYVEKMIEIGASQHFFQVFVLSGGIEGGLAFPVASRSGVTLSSFSGDGLDSHLVDSQKVTPKDVLSEKTRDNIRYENSPSWLSCNAELVSRVWDHTRSGDETFDVIVKATLQALDYSIQSKMESFVNEKMESNLD